MMPGETILSGGALPEGFQKFEVLSSQAGYYVGTTEEGEPYSRETTYTQDLDQAIDWMKQINEVVVDGRLTMDEDVLNRVAFLFFVRQ